MLINTLPIIFTYIHLFSLLEAVIFLTAIFCLVYFYTPVPNRNWRHTPAKNVYAFLQSAWLGQTDLWRAFWPFFLLVNGILYYVDYRIMAISYTIASWKTMHVILFLPIVWWTSSVWRCSANTRHKIWGGSARAITVYLYLELALRFFISYQHPTTLFDCRLLVIEYGDCW